MTAAIFLVLALDGAELLSTPFAERATYAMNRLDGADRVETDGGVLIATRVPVMGGSIHEWMVRLGRMR